MSEKLPARLGGETDPNSWHFSRLGEDGPLPNPVGHTFPFITHDLEGKWSLIGTGFYVGDSGLFVTAKHVIEEVRRNNKQILPLVILHFHSTTGLFGAQECHFRPIGQCWLSETADVAFGSAATATHKETGEIIRNWAWTLSFAVPEVGALAHTYAFPNHLVAENGRRIRFSPHLYSGRILSSGGFRDRVMVPFPYIEVDFRMHGAASGGPVLSNGRAVGVNCTEWPQNLDHPPGPGFGAQSSCLFDAYLDNVILPKEELPRRVTFDELVQGGCLQVESYTPAESVKTSCGELVDLTMPVGAAFPAVELEQYF